jgi:hypothetical protein
MPLVLKNPADVQGHKVCFRDPVDIASDGKVSDCSRMIDWDDVNPWEPVGGDS